MADGINERIESILQQRKPMSESVKKSLDMLSGVSNALANFSKSCRPILDQSDSAHREIKQIFDDANEISDKVEDLRPHLERLKNRFSRKTLNIAVIGMARQGKSRLLQTITGLTSEEIPDGNKAHCTGVRSDIINDLNA